MPLLEVAIETPADALAAAGADRLELSSALALGGLTPTPGLFHEIRRTSPLPVVVMIRPRPGDFVYIDADFRVMADDLAAVLPHRPAGFVFGGLTPDGDIDPRCGKLVRQAAGVPCVFHRAFDVCRDPFVAAETLVSLGFKRVLTSGQKPTALEGAPLIRQLRERFPALEWLPGGSVRAGNVRAVLEATGCDQVHGAFTEPGRPGTNREMVTDARRVLDGV